MRFSVHFSVGAFTTPRRFAFVAFFINPRCAVSVPVVRKINRPFSATGVYFYHGKDKSPLVLRVCNCCRCALLNVTQNSRTINCTESPLNPCLLRVSSSRDPEWRFRPLPGQSESDSLIELMFAYRDTSTHRVQKGLHYQNHNLRKQA